MDAMPRAADVEPVAAAPALAGEPAASAETAANRRRLIFGIVTIGLFMASVDQTIVATALPALQRELHAPVNWSGWTITVYSVGQVLSLSLAGRVGDRYGRKKVLLAAVTVFTAASLCCGLAGNIYELVVLRFVQAFGGGALMPSASGIVSDHFGRDRDRALGLFSSIFPIGAVVGPILGGVLVSGWSWRGIFLVNVPIGALLVTLAVRYVPRDNPRLAARTDGTGVLLLSLCLLPAMFAISYLGTGNTSVANPVTIAGVAVALVAGWRFVAHVKRTPTPVISPRFLLGESFGLINIINFFYGAAAFGFSALVPLYAEERYGLHALEAGTLLTARGVGSIALSGLAVWALRRTGYRLPMMAGFLLIAVGLVLLAMSPPAFSPYGWMALAAAITGIGVGVGNPAFNNASLQLAPDQVAANAGLRGTFRQAGAIMAVSVTTALLARSDHPGLLQADVFVGFALMLVVLIPLLWRVPDHRGSW